MTFVNGIMNIYVTLLGAARSQDFTDWYNPATGQQNDIFLCNDLVTKTEIWATKDRGRDQFHVSKTEDNTWINSEMACLISHTRNNCVSSLFPMSASSYRSIGEFLRTQAQSDSKHASRWGTMRPSRVHLELQNYPFGYSTNMSVARAKALVMQ